MRGRLGELPIDLRVDKERRGDFVPVPAVVRGVLVIALDLAGVRVERKRPVRVEIVGRSAAWCPCPRRGPPPGLLDGVGTGASGTSWHTATVGSRSWHQAR